MKNQSSKYKIIHCSQCGKKYVTYKNNTTCPYCGQKNKYNPDISNRYLKIITIVTLALLISVSLASGISLYNNSNKINNLTGQLEELQITANNFKKDLTETQTDLEYYQNQYSQAQEEIKNYQDQQSKIDELTKQQTDLQAKYDQLNQENASLKEENSSLKSENESLKATSSQSFGSGGSVATNVENSITTSGTSNQITSMVWITATGSKYHNKPDCGNSNPATSTQISLSEAQARGYGPCSKCY